MGAAEHDLLRCARVLPEDKVVDHGPPCGTMAASPPVRSWNERTVRRRPDGCLEVTDLWARYELHQKHVVLLGYTMKRRVMKSGVLPLDKTA